MELEEILERLLGNVAPVADTTVDEKRLQNISNYEKALFFIVRELQDAAEWRTDNRISAKVIGLNCYDILKSLKEDLEELED